MSRTAAEVLREDDALTPLVEEHGPLGLSPADDLFERAVVSLVRQQVSIAAAESIRERLFGRVAVTPDSTLAADEATLREAGLSTAKVGYARALAERFRAREHDHAYFEGMDDEAVVTELTDIHSVGPWTAKMFRLFCFGRPDVFPVEDLWIRKAVRAVTGDDGMTQAAMRNRAGEWAPYRSFASLYLWRAVD